MQSSEWGFPLGGSCRGRVEYEKEGKGGKGGVGWDMVVCCRRRGQGGGFVDRVCYPGDCGWYAQDLGSRMLKY